MGETPLPGGGDPMGIPTSSRQGRPDQSFAGAAKTASGIVPGDRSWQQIFRDAKEKRNILKIHINKITTENQQENTTERPKALTFN